LIGTSKISIFFSAALSPSIGFFANTGTCVAFHVAKLLFELLFGSSSYAYHLPTFVGTYYLASHTTATKIALPLICITLFLTHPVGITVPHYPLYWLIPIVITLSKTESIFLRSLGSTLSTHAVGTLLWLYSHPVTTPLLKHLFCIVWYERLFYAFCLTAVYYGFSYCMSIIAYERERYA
jgi:hypothetical protein